MQCGRPMYKAAEAGSSVGDAEPRREGTGGKDLLRFLGSEVQVRDARFNR